MTAQRDEGERTASIIGGLRRRLVPVLRTPIGFTVALLAIVWLVLPFLPEGSGLRFGTGYLVFFSVIIVAAGLFFWLLRLGPIPQPRSSFGVAASIGLVYLVTVGVLVGAGNAYLQFSTPSAEDQDQAELTAAERGEQLFWSRDVTTSPCFACHNIAGRGGTRAPDMAGLAMRAGTRVPGVSAEEYIEGHIRQGSGYSFTVPQYAPIMVPFGSLLSDDEIADLVAFLMSLE